MRRRDFILGLGGSAVSSTYPRLGRAQQSGRIHRIGFLVPVGRQSPGIVAFFDEMRLNGFVEGQNLAVIPDGFDAGNEPTRQLVAAMVQAAPDAVICGGEVTTRALQQATSSIPLFGMSEDMLTSGLVSSLARPGGNTTGISLLSSELDGKRQEFLIEAVPGARRIATVVDSNIYRSKHLSVLEHAAKKGGVEFSAFSVASREEIVSALDAANASGAKALNILSSPLLYLNRHIIFERVAEQRMPAIYQWPEMAEEGGLVGYGPRFTQLFRQRARMVVKVFRGAKVGDIPVEQPTNFELAINLKTAKAIGHGVPVSLILRADKVIE